MTVRIKSALVLILCIITAFFCTFTAAASNESTVAEKLAEKDSIICISHRGDTILYPANSLEGIVSAVNKGADIVSVNVMKTKDGVLVLCEDKPFSSVCNTQAESVSELNYSEVEQLYLLGAGYMSYAFRVATLSSALSVCDMGAMLLLDYDPSIADDIYSFLLNENALSKVILRTEQNPLKINEWLTDKPVKPLVMAVYDGNIIFSAISHLEKMSSVGMPCVQYQSKNHFNVMFGEFISKYYLKSDAPRVAVSFCDPDFSGQRSDSEDGWNELIKKGFTVIETNNIVSLSEYIESAQSLKVSLSAVLKKAQSIDLSVYSQVSADNLSKAAKNAEYLLSKGAVSCDELQKAQSELILSIDKLAQKKAEDTQKGALNITFGKVLAAVLVGTAILAAQIFVHKMQRKKEK